MADGEAKGIRVWVVYRDDRNEFTLRWRDPQTGRLRQKSTKAAKRNDAYQEAGRLAATLEANGGRLNGESVERPTWDAFCTRYRTNCLTRTSPTNQAKWRKVVQTVDDEFFDRKIKEPMLSDITTEFLESVSSRMIAGGNAPATVKSKMDTLFSGLNWAVSLKLMPPIQTIRERGRKEKIDVEMRGRPLTGEELDRMIDQVRVHSTTKANPDGWIHLLRGLDLSGLRLSEALRLHESRPDCHRPMGLNGRRPAIAFVASQKNRCDQVVAITPDFAKLLLETVTINGWYFNPLGVNGRYLTVGAVGNVVSKLGEAARIVTDATGEVSQYATAHDLRRTFARRWAAKVMPPILQHLMRHRSIETTLKFYVGSAADSAAHAIWDAWDRGGRAVSAVEVCDQVCDQLNSIA